VPETLTSRSVRTVSGVPLVLLRLWVPDRPGALGLVASRIGSVRGDVVGIEIIDRGAGQVVDELVVDIPSDVSQDLLVREVSQVDGVSVEEVREATGFPRDARVEALETAEALIASESEAELLDFLTNHVAESFDADWAAVLDLDGPDVLASTGRGVPPASWLRVFALGSQGAQSGTAAPAAVMEVVSAPFERGSLVAVLGRQGRAFRTGERQRLAALLRIASLRWHEVRLRESLRSHPSISGSA